MRDNNPPRLEQYLSSIEVNMGRATLAAKWQNIYRRSVRYHNDTITVQVENNPRSSRMSSAWNDIVGVGRINSAFTSILTQASSRTKRQTTVIDSKGQKHQLHYTIGRTQAATPMMEEPRDEFLMTDSAMSGHCGIRVQENEGRCSGIKRPSEYELTHVKKVCSGPEPRAPASVDAEMA